MPPHLFIITGAMAAGKSTVGEALARSFPKSVHLRGDIFRKMIVNGAAEMGPALSEDAQAQLTLRHGIATDVARRYYQAGFSVIYQDIILGPDLEVVAAQLADLSPRIIVLAPDVETLSQRDRDREKTGYGEGFPPSVLADALVRDTPRLGVWINTSAMSVDAVVKHILAS